MAFNLATAFVELGVKGFGDVDSAIGRVKANLSKLVKGAGPLDISKGLMAGLKNAGAGLKANIGNIGTAFSEALSSAKAGGGVVKSIVAGMELAGPELAAALTNPITGGIVAGVGAALLTIPGAIERETRLTRLGIQTGSEGNAKQLAGGLKSTFTGTGIDAESLSGVTAEMASKGMSPEKITSQMRILGNISTATGESINGMAEALARTEASGKVTGRTLQAMRPVAEELAREYHVSTEQIFTMAESGTIKIGQLQKAMEKLGGETGRWGSALATMQHTTAGEWEKMTTEITGLFADVGTVIMDALDLKDVFAMFRSFIALVRELEGAINDIVPIGKILGGIIWLIVKPIQLVLDALTWVVKRIREAIAAFKEFLYTTTFGLFGEKGGGQGSLATRKTAGMGESYGFTGVTQLAEKMQSEAGKVGILDVVDQQKITNEHLAAIRNKSDTAQQPQFSS